MQRNTEIFTLRIFLGLGLVKQGQKVPRSEATEKDFFVAKCNLLTIYTHAIYKGWKVKFKTFYFSSQHILIQSKQMYELLYYYVRTVYLLCSSRRKQRFAVSLCFRWKRSSYSVNWLKFNSRIDAMNLWWFRLAKYIRSLFYKCQVKDLCRVVLYVQDPAEKMFNIFASEN